MKKTKLLKRFNIHSSKHFHISNQFYSKILFLNNFVLFFLFKYIKYKFSKKFIVNKNAGQKKKKIF